jgi:hypothetical protein
MFPSLDCGPIGFSSLFSQQYVNLSTLSLVKTSPTKCHQECDDNRSLDTLYYHV